MKKRTKRIGQLSISGFLSIFIAGSIGAQTPSGSLLWEVSGNGLDKPSYLFGSIHMYDPASFQLPTLVFELIERCDAFAMEINTDDIDPAEINARTIIEGDSTLDLLMGEEAFAKLMGVPMPKLIGAEAVKRIKPLFVTSLLLLDNSGTPMPSVDIELFTHAKAQSKQVIGLETVAEQLDAVDAIPMSEQAEMLVAALDKFSSPKETLQKLCKAYKSQDFKLLEKEMEESNASPLFSEQLLSKRNVRMADRLAERIVGGQTLFTAIGALHLGDTQDMKGVVTLLKEKGYTLTPVKLTFQ